MGQLAERIALVMREHGFDPAARQADIQALAHLEESDNSLAQTRFHALKSHVLREARALLIARLKAHAFVLDLPPRDTTGYTSREIETELRRLGRAAALASQIAAAQEEESKLRASVLARALPPTGALPPSAWDDLARLVETAEASRRAVAREARLEARARDAKKRGDKLGIATPPLAGATDDDLDRAEEKLREAEGLAEAHALALAPLRDPAVGAWRGESRKALLREAEALLATRDASALRALAAKSENLRREAAKANEDAARSRRAGRAPPPKERRSTDAMDPYG